MSQRTYAPEDHQIGHGGKLSYCDTAIGTYIEIRGIQECNVPESELGESETTNDDSPDFHKEYTLGMYEPGTATFSYVFQPNQFGDIDALYMLASVAANRLLRDAANSPIKYWKHTTPDGSVHAFKGWVKSNKLPRDQEGTLVSEAEIRVIGKTAFTPAA